MRELETSMLITNAYTNRGVDVQGAGSDGRRRGAWRSWLAGLALLLNAGVGMESLEAGLYAAGPNDPAHGFPIWVQDANGVTLELCLDDSGYCIFDPVIPGNLLSENIGFGPEAFWFMAETHMDLRLGGINDPGGVANRAILVLAMEAAWGSEVPQTGQQFAFSRLRIRVDVPVPGHYRVIHPYGVEEFDVPFEAIGKGAINITRDIGGFGPEFSAMMSGDVGPFLTAVSPEPPPGYLGDPLLPGGYLVQGSPVGQNLFRVEGPPGSNLDGEGNDFVENDRFMLMGKCFTGEAPTPAFVERVTYEEAEVRHLDVFVQASPDATVTVATDDGGALLAGDGLGAFSGSILLREGEQEPSTLMITADDPRNKPTELLATVTDRVQVTLAEYDPLSGVLTVEAHSSMDACGATLCVNGCELVGGRMQAEFPVAPVEVVARSCFGGSHSVPTRIVIRPDLVATNVPPVAVDDYTSMHEDTVVVCDLLANDYDPDGSLVSVQLLNSPRSGVVEVRQPGILVYTPGANFNGVEQISYVVYDDAGAISAGAVVTIDVLPVNDAPVANDDVASTPFNTPVEIEVLGNDVDPDGLADIDPASVTVAVAPQHGSLTVRPADGGIIYTPDNNYAGPEVFSYVVFDRQGVASNLASVSVDITGNPNVESLTGVVSYNRRRELWDIRGQTSLLDPTMTFEMWLGAPVTGQLIGTASPNAVGKFAARVHNPAIVPKPFDQVTIVSSGGATISVVVTLR